ncbi:MAG TPA: PDZ domain-containing protein [Bryobacteraceae bacterium]
MRIHGLVLAAGLAIPVLAQQAFFQAPPGFQGLPVQGQQNSSYLGVGLREIGPDRAKALKLPEEAGVEVTQVYENSPAASAGLMAGDVVLEYNGQRVEGMEQFARLVRETPAGREIKLQIFRNGGTQTIAVRLGPRPPETLYKLAPPNPPASLTPFRPYSGAVMGLETEALSGQLANYFGVKEGVLVKSVNANSPAERAGIKAGDVITRVGDANVTSPVEIASQLRLRPGQSVSVTLTRDHREITVNVPLQP